MTFTITISLFCLIFSQALPVHAGFFSFLDNLFKNNETLTKPLPNSQTMVLLEGTSCPDPTANTGGGDVTIVNQSALLPDSGPLGTIADVKDKKPNSEQISVYIVREGDNLSQIADMFGVSVNTIIWTNDLKRGSLIAPGQTLVILPVSGIQYTIKSGDTIASIAKKYNGDASEIINFNGLIDGKGLTIGEIIVIPNGEYETPTTSTTQTYTASQPKTVSSVSYAGYYIRPIEGGRRSQGIHGYNAVDLANSCGTPIMASASGDVIISRASGWNAGYGNYVVISHSNGTQTLYAHMSSVIVSNGWHVVQGQIIGYIGTTGKSTGCHVHFEIRGAKNPF